MFEKPDRIAKTCFLSFMGKESDYYRLIPREEQKPRKHVPLRKIMQGVSAGIMVLGLGTIGYKGFESLLTQDNQQRKREEVARIEEWLLEAYSRLSDEVCDNNTFSKDEDMYWACHNVQIQEEQYDEANGDGLLDGKYRHKQEENFAWMMMGGLTTLLGGFGMLSLANSSSSGEKVEETVDQQTEDTQG